MRRGLLFAIFFFSIVFLFVFFYLLNFLSFSNHLTTLSCSTDKNQIIIDKNSPCNYQVLKTTESKTQFYMKSALKKFSAEGNKAFAQAYFPGLFGMIPIKIQLGKDSKDLATLAVCSYQDENLIEGQPTAYTCTIRKPSSFANETREERSTLLTFRSGLKNEKDSKCNQRFIEIFEKKKGYLSLLLFATSGCKPIVDQLFLL